MSGKNANFAGSNIAIVTVVALWLAVLIYSTIALSNSYISPNVSIMSVVSTALLVLAGLPISAVIHYTNKDPSARHITRGLLWFVLLIVFSDVTVYLIDNVVGKPIVDDLGQLLYVGSCFAILIPACIAGLRPKSQRQELLLLSVAAISLIGLSLFTFFATSGFRTTQLNGGPIMWSAAFIVMEAMVILVPVRQLFSDLPQNIKNLYLLIAVYFAIELVGDAFNLYTLLNLSFAVDSDFVTTFSATCYSVANVFLTAALWLYSWKTINPFTVKKVNDTLIETRRMMDDLIRESPDAICIYSPEGIPVMANERFGQLRALRSEGTAYEQNLFEGMRKMGMPESDLAKLKNGESLVLKDLLYPPEQLHFSVKVYPTRSADGVVTGYISIVEDITERVIIQEKMRASLEEKNVLLKEIHHRVKNNLQIISSLLNLQSGYIEDSTVLGYFRESQNRVKSMAMIHERLYQTENLSMVDFTDYIRKLSEFLLRSYNISPGRVRLNLEIEPISLNVDKAISCGLILNELLINSLKYAFPDDRSGEITIRMKVEDNLCVLVISDNGIGFPKNIDYRNTTTLGMQLIVLLTGQIDGTIELDATNGTSFTLVFPA